MTDFFKDYNPWVQFVFFLLVIGATMFLRHPVIQTLSFIGALSYLGLQANGDELKNSLHIALGTGFLIALINPLLVHQGVTILGYFHNGNPITLESIVFGISAGFMFATVLLWFSCHNRIMTSDKILYISGNIFPALSLIFSMVLRFVPLYRERIRTIQACRRGIGEDGREGSFFQRLKSGLKVFSIFVTWSLESSIETADSMKARGHGLKGRTHFALFRFEKRDIVSLLFLIMCLVALIIGSYMRQFKIVIYPTIKIAKMTPMTYLFFALFIIAAFLPIILSAREEYRWKSSR